MRKVKNVKIDYARMQEVHEDLDTERYGRLQLGVNCVELHKAGELLAMAMENIYPDGSYSDYECCVWEEFRRVIRAENNSVVDTSEQYNKLNETIGRISEITDEMERTLVKARARIQKIKEGKS